MKGLSGTPWLLAFAIAACSDSPGQDPDACGACGDADSSADASTERDGQVAGDASSATCEAGDLGPRLSTVVLLVNMSGTMGRELSGESRWDGVQGVLSSGLLAEFESEARLGATLFSSQDGFNGGACPLIRRTDPLYENASTIVALMAENEPIVDTPTAETIDLVAQELVELRSERPDLHPHPVIVFVTDGSPDTCEQPNPNEGAEEAIAAVQAAYADGVSTIMIGLNDETAVSYFQAMANAGAGLPVSGGDNAELFRGGDRESLFDAYEQALLRTRSCVYTLVGNGTDALQVSLEGELLDPGTEWQLVDSTTVQLLGSACATVRSTKDYELQASCDDSE